MSGITPFQRLQVAQVSQTVIGHDQLAEIIDGGLLGRHNFAGR
jgi:hypothetical protein